MKKTQFLELLCTIKKTMVSFISIAFFVLLGAAIFLGINWSVTGYKNTVNNTLEEWNMHDIEITFPYGFDQNEINKIKQLDYIDEVEGKNSFEAVFVNNNSRHQAKIILITNKIDDAHKILGDIPTKKGEIGFERFWAENNGIKIGDTICFEHDDDGTAHIIHDLLNEDLDALQNNKKTEDGMMYLTTDKFVVTGLFENATYISQYKVTYGVSATTSIPNDCIAYVAEDSIDSKAFNGYRTLLLTVPELRNFNTFDDEYKEINNRIIDRLEIDLQNYVNSTNNKISTSIDNIRLEINKQINDKEAKILKGEKELVDGEKKIKDGEIKLAEGKAELISAENQLAEARDKLDKAWKQYYASLEEYKVEKDKIDKLNKIYNGAIKAIDIYQKIKNVPTYIEPFYVNYLESESTIKSILDNYDSEAKIKQFFLDYKDGVYDEKVFDCATAIKDIINADGYAQLKEELNNLDPDKHDEVMPLINFIEEIDAGIDDVVATYQLFKNNTLSQFLEGTTISITNDVKTKIENVIEYINSDIETAYNDVQKYKIIIDAFLNKFDPIIDKVKTTLETEIKPQLDAAYSQLSSAKDKLDSGYMELKDGEQQYEEGLVLYEEGLEEIKNNETLVKKYKQDLIDGKQALVEGKEELENAKNKVKDFDSIIEQIKDYDISSLGRNLNGGVGSTSVPIDMMDSIKYTMVLLFVIVGVFVCYSALSRSVYDQTIQIGTKKALGLSKKEITISFLSYGTLATLIGCVAGVALARFVIEPVILNGFAKNYIISDNQYHFSLKESLLFLLFELVVTNITSYLACNKVLKKKAVKLLQGPEDLIGKSHFYEKLPGWNRLSLLTKTIINNCVNDKRRVLSTLVGIAGCCSLMVCAITLITNMNDSLNYQMKEVAKFDTIVYFDESVEGSLENINHKLDEMNIDHYASTYSSCAIENNKGDYITGAFFVYDDERFFDFFNVAIDEVKQSIGEGICVTKAYAQKNNVNIGDYVVVVDSLGEKHNIKVSNIFDFYLLRVQTIMNRDSYIKEFGKDPVKNGILIKRGNYTNSDINNMLYPIDGYISSFDYAEESVNLYSSLTDSIMIIVVAFFVLAVILAFLVLLNLLIMFVDEKKKELIVMMINGYSRKKVKTYIYADTIFLTIIGIIVGIVIGVIVGFATIKTFDSDCVTIMRNINIPSYLLCGALTGLLSAISCLIALRKVNNFKLTEINSK